MYAKDNSAKKLRTRVNKKLNGEDSKNVPNLKPLTNPQNYKNIEFLTRILKNFYFPDEKDSVLKYIENKTDDGDLIKKIERIEDKEYLNISEVLYEAGFVY